jgi:hypothetical protein
MTIDIVYSSGLMTARHQVEFLINRLSGA